MKSDVETDDEKCETVKNHIETDMRHAIMKAVTTVLEPPNILQHSIHDRRNVEKSKL